MMGCNYYWYSDPPCPTCGRTPSQRLHVGKSSSGWCFALATHPDDGLDDFTDWETRLFLCGGEIQDEYGRIVTATEMVAVITDRATYASPAEPTNEWLKENNATVGPFGLARHRIDGKYCIGNGWGTWDLMRGEFS